MSRIFVSHSSKDNRQAQALRAWLVAQDPPLANEIFLDTDTDTGLKPGVKWKTELVSANSRCEAVDLSAVEQLGILGGMPGRVPDRGKPRASRSCAPACRTAPARYTSEWQHTDLFADGLAARMSKPLPVTGGPRWCSPKRVCVSCVRRYAAPGIAADNFVWPPPAQPDRAPYRGWEPFEEIDAGVFFGRDAQIVRALDMLRGDAHHRRGQPVRGAGPVRVRASRRFCGPGCCHGCTAKTATSCCWTSCAPDATR